MAYSKLGEKIKFFRQRAGLTQFNLELEIGLAQGAISRIESGKVNPTKETVFNIANILKLNNWELDYLIGKTQKPATKQEILQAQSYVKKYFSKPTTFAYMTDERSRVIAISKGFKIFAKIDKTKEKKLLLNLFPLMLLKDEFGIKQFIDETKYTEILKMAFARTFTEMGFMRNDPYLVLIEKEIKRHKELNRIWKTFKENKEKSLPVRTLKSQIVHISYKGLKFKLMYHSEVLPINPRFCILDYRPNNILLKIVKKMI